MLSPEAVPDRPEQLARLFVQLPRLLHDSPTSCPLALEELLEHLADETSEGRVLVADDLTFVRTALLDDVRYWVYRVTDTGDGTPAWACVAEEPGGAATLGYVLDPWGLTAEQLVIGDRFGVI